MGLNHSCRRDLLGYGPEPPDPQWPNQAKVAVQFDILSLGGRERVFGALPIEDPQKRVV